jgi:hypothetical protein
MVHTTNSFLGASVIDGIGLYAARIFLREKSICLRGVPDECHLRNLQLDIRMNAPDCLLLNELIV